MKKIMILGGHGDGVVIASALKDLQAKDHNIIPYGFLNDNETPGRYINDLPVIDQIRNAYKYIEKKNLFFISALLKVKESYQRSKLISELNIPLERFFTLIHPQATISKDAKIGFGTFIGPHVTIMPNAIIGNHCSFRSSASVGHDCLIGDYCYMGPNSTLSGRVQLNSGVHIGANACVIERTKLGQFSVVGAGSTLLKELPEFVVAFGCPAKIFEHLKERQ